MRNIGWLVNALSGKEIAMLKVVHSEHSSEIVESTAEAVDLVWGFGSYVELLNPLKKGLTEIQRIVRDRVATMDAPDQWPGARYEADLIPIRWVRPYGQAGRMAWPSKAKVDQVRA
jgi:hypothetical protein